MTPSPTDANITLYLDAPLYELVLIYTIKFTKPAFLLWMPNYRSFQAVQIISPDMTKYVLV